MPPTLALRIIAALLGACLSAATAAYVIAGQPHPSSLAFRCDRQQNRLELVVAGYAARGAALRHVGGEGAHSDCTFADGTLIRIRTGRGLASAVGPCGANPPSFFSLWVNRRKVISREPYENCSGLVLRGILVDDRIIRHCWFQERSPIGGSPYSGSDGPWTCTEQPVPIRGAGRDYIEYPPPGTPPAQPAPLRLLASSNARLCPLWAADHRLDGLPPGGEEPPWERAPVLGDRVYDGWAAPPAVAEFDFDNDGQADSVWRVEIRDAGFVGDFYFIVRPGGAPTEEWLGELYGEELRGSGNLQRAPRQIVPESVVVYGGNVSTFRGRQVWWTAFRFEGRTYLSGWQWWDRVRHIIAEPHDGRLRTVCILDRPRDNF